MNHLHNAVRKCTQPFKGMWCGYLNPKEILALNDIEVDSDERDITMALDWKRRGISNGRWFYFKPNKRFETLHYGLRRNYH